MPGTISSPRRISAVIFDWAGTLIDFGSLAPVLALQGLFELHNVPLTNEEVRAPMGLLKRDHIRELLAMPRIRAAWTQTHGTPDEQTVDSLNTELEQRMPELAAKRAEPLPGVVEILHRLRARDIRIGSTTGYTRTTMNMVQPAARDAGIVVEALLTPSEVPAGRPYPWMMFANFQALNVYPPECVVKVGDTLQDIAEGRNAGAWTVGVLVGSSQLGLSAEEFTQLDENTREQRIEEARAAFTRAGAHYVMRSMDELDTVIDAIEHRLTERH
jgi:phosphonoacetaldehyde hydrolase